MQSSLFNHKDVRFSNPTVNFILRNFQSKYRLDFDNVKKQWSNRLHNILREAMKLKFSDRDEDLHSYSISIPVKYLSDMNGIFINKIEELYPDLDFYEYARLKEFLYSANKINDYIQNTHAYDNLLSLKEFVQNKLKRYDLDSISENLFNSLFNYSEKKYQERDYDVLGAYFNKSHQIEIYYVPIFIFSTLHKIEPSSLFLVVLAHEFAHAYHQMGFDIDGHQWESFQTVDRNIKESLAQFYTEIFCIKMNLFLPEIYNAYNTLLGHQPEHYKIHTEWRKKYSLESIRKVLI